jgi:IBR domain.
MSDFENDDIDEVDEIEFDYDEGDESSFVFESEDEYESEEEPRPAKFSPGRSNDDKSSKYNDTVYHPWTLAIFIQKQFLDKLEKLKGAKLPNCSESDLLIMLQSRKWQPDDVINDFYDNKQQLYSSSGIPMPPLVSHNTFENKKFACTICCESYDMVTVYSLTCGHEFCINCYYHYIYNEIGHGRLISCITPECNYKIPHDDLEEILYYIEGKNELVRIERVLSSNRLLDSTAKIYIDAHASYKWCPSTDCTNFTELIHSPGQDETRENESKDISKVPIVACLDSHEFCFGCKYENHLPCPCWIVKKWIQKCEDDSETANWIEANTHSCPKCGSAIEKNGGCNHMICKKCKSEFCWICMGNWSEHNNSYYRCNRFREENVEEETKKTKSRLSLNRYLHFYKRFTVHESSMEGDRRTIDKINNIARLYMELRRTEGESNKGPKILSWNEIQFLPDAIHSLTNGRKTLKWTYTFAFYLGDSNFSTIFEGNQNYLNKTVEDLSEIFEKILKEGKYNNIETLLKKKNKIIALSDLITLRQRTLISSAEYYLNQDLLSFVI